MVEARKIYELLYPDPKDRPEADIQRDVEAGIQRGKNITWYPGVPNPDRNFLEEGTYVMARKLFLPQYPLAIMSDILEAEDFLSEAKSNGEWGNAWGALQADALDAASDSGRIEIWSKSRKDAALAVEDKLRQYPSSLRLTERDRFCAYVQWIVVADLMPSNNALETFMEVNEYGGSLLGIVKNKFGVFIPPHKL